MSYEQTLVWGLGIGSLYFMAKSYFHKLTDFKTFMEFDKSNEEENEKEKKQQKKKQDDSLDFKKITTYVMSELYKIISYLLMFALFYVLKEVAVLNVPGSNTAGVYQAIFDFIFYFLIFEALILVVKVTSTVIDLFKGIGEDMEEYDR